MAYNELYHHGIKGQKWGVRRFRNTDGTLTSAGKRRAKASADRDKVNEIRKKKVSEMSNQELRDANNRLQLERQYNDLTRKKSIGKKAVTAIVTTAGTIAALEGAINTYRKVGEKILKKIGNASA